MPLIIINTAPQNMIKGMPSLELTNIPDNCEATKRVTIKPTTMKTAAITEIITAHLSLPVAAALTFRHHQVKIATMPLARAATV